MIATAADERAHRGSDRAASKPALETAADLRNWRLVLVFTVKPPGLAWVVTLESSGARPRTAEVASPSKRLLSSSYIAREKLGVKH